MERNWQFVICSACEGAKALEQAVARACPGVEIVRQPCLSVCAAPVTIAAQGSGRATYVFSGLSPEDEADIAIFAREYEAAPAGWIEDARPLGRLRSRLVTRVQAMAGS